MSNENNSETYQNLNTRALLKTACEFMKQAEAEKRAYVEDVQPTVDALVRCGIVLPENADNAIKKMASDPRSALATLRQIAAISVRSDVPSNGKSEAGNMSSETTKQSKAENDWIRNVLNMS